MKIYDPEIRIEYTGPRLVLYWSKTKPSLVKSLACAIAILVSACAPTVTVEPIAPKAVVVREAAKVITKKTEAVQTVLQRASTQTTGLVAEADKLVAETARLKNSEGVTPGDLDALWTMATKVQSHATLLGDTQREATAATEDLHVSTVAQEAETAELSKHAEATDKNTANLNLQKEALKDDAALGKSVKWIIGGVLTLLLVVFILRKTL